MSWSMTVIGTSENIRNALQSESKRLTGASKQEFDEALPHLAALVGMNVNTNREQLLELEARGHASHVDGVEKYRNVSIRLDLSNKRLV